MVKKKHIYKMQSRSYLIKAISKRLIRQIKAIQRKIEKDNNLARGTVSFVWVSDNLEVKYKK